MKAHVLLEVCVDTIDDLVAALDGGAERIELCSALSVGGLTPSAGFASRAVELAQGQSVPVRAMVRPRDGDFAYSAVDLETAEAEGIALLKLGVDGLVFGATRAAFLDRDALGRWCDAMRRVRPDVGLTLHRAIDLVADQLGAVDLAAELGFDCILSSGGAERADEGLPILDAMRERAGGRIAIMPGSGVRSANVVSIVEATGVGAVHASAAVGAGAAPDPRVLELGFAVGPRRRTCAREVHALRTALDTWESA